MMNIKFTFKGALILFAGTFLINIFIPQLLVAINVSYDHAVILANTFLSSAVVTFVLTRIDGQNQGRNHTLKVYGLVSILFLVVSTLWMSGIFV